MLINVICGPSRWVRSIGTRPRRELLATDELARSVWSTRHGGVGAEGAVDDKPMIAGRRQRTHTRSARLTARPGPIAGHAARRVRAATRLRARGLQFSTCWCGRAELGSSTDRAATFDFAPGVEPQVVVDAAARVGGNLANDAYLADFLSETSRSRSTC